VPTVLEVSTLVMRGLDAASFNASAPPSEWPATPHGPGGRRSSIARAWRSHRPMSK
jgi:hypothetical protein